MNKELKKAIVNFIFENESEFQLHNATVEKFRQYIYNGAGQYLVGGQEVVTFIGDAIRLIKN